MSTNPCTSHVSPQDEALVHVEQLIEELHVAMSGVARNSVEEMEHSLWRQEMLCAALARTVHRLRGAPHHDANLVAMHSAAAALGCVNRTYGSLVQQGKRSVAPLLELCYSYRGTSASSPDPLITPLSCEA